MYATCFTGYQSPLSSTPINAPEMLYSFAVMVNEFPETVIFPSDEG